MARAKHRRGGCLSRLIMFALLIFILAYPFYEAANLTVETVNLTVSGLPQDLNHLKIVYLSDIHQGPFYSMGRVEKLVSQVNAMNADLVLLGGDYANDSDGAVAFFKNAPPFRARLLVAGVVGNHDRTEPESNLAALQSAMINAGVLPLVNAVKEVRVGASSLYLAGIDDVNNGHPDVAGVASQLSRDQFVIFLSHSPDAIPGAFDAVDRSGQKNWFDLALSGHTHGGQITFFGKALLSYSNVAKVDSRYLSGWVTENKTPILVSNGVGTSVAPIRLFAKPQLHVITLTAGK